MSGQICHDHCDRWENTDGNRRHSDNCQELDTGREQAADHDNNVMT